MDRVSDGSPLSPSTWLRGSAATPVARSATPGYGRLFGVGLLLAMVGMFGGAMTGNAVGRIDPLLPWLLLASAWWSVPRRLPLARAVDPTLHARALLAVAASALTFVPIVASELAQGLFRPAQVSDVPPLHLSSILGWTLVTLLPMFALLLGLVPRRLLALAARPALVAALAIGAPLALVAAARGVWHPDPNGYVASLDRVRPAPPRSIRPGVGHPGVPVPVTVGRCTLWQGGGSYALSEPYAEDLSEWMSPGYHRPLLVDRRREILYVPDMWQPRALDLSDCHVFSPSLQGLATGLAPPVWWTLAALVGGLAAAVTLRRARSFRRALGDPAAWRDATRTTDGELVFADDVARLRAHGGDPNYTGPVVVLRIAAASPAQYRDAPAVGGDAYVEGDRAALLRAVAAARTVAEVEALTYVVASAAPLAACAMAGLYG